MNAEHTPTPWEQDGAYVVSRLTDIPHVDIADCARPLTSSVALGKANAAFIVKAVNSHDALVAALTEAREQIAEMVEAWDGPSRPGLWRSNSLGTLDRIDRALSETATPIRGETL